MGIFRGGLLVISVVLFFLAILVQGFFLIVYLSLDYDSVNSRFSSIASGMLEEEVPLVLLEQSQEQISGMIEEKYYKEYDCKFFDCIKKTNESLSLVSKHAQDYWKGRFLSFLIVSLVLAGVVFLLVEHKPNFLFISSILFGLSSLIFLKLNSIATIILKPLFAAESSLGELSFYSFIDMFSIFLSRAPEVFIWFAVIGILFLVTWIIIKVLEIGFEISSIIEKISGLFGKKKDSQPTPAEKEVKKSVSKKQEK